MAGDIHGDWVNSKIDISREEHLKSRSMVWAGDHVPEVSGRKKSPHEICFADKLYC